MTNTTSPVLPDHVPQGVLAKELGITLRTLARYRELGLPYARIGGKVFIHREGARAFFDNRTVGLKTKSSAPRPATRVRRARQAGTIRSVMTLTNRNPRTGNNAGVSADQCSSRKNESRGTLPEHRDQASDSGGENPASLQTMRCGAASV